MDSLRIRPALPAAPKIVDAPQRILVVDDLPEICMLFRDIHKRLRHHNVELVTETNSQRAADLVRAQRFDVVVSDFRMRQVDGIEVLRAARMGKPDGFRVLMTGYNEIPTSVERIREAGVDAYVQKPLQAQELLLMLLGFLRQDRAIIEENRSHARELEALADTSTVALG